MWVLFDLACVAFLFSLLLTPLVRNAAMRFALVDRPDHGRKLHTEPIPRLGGLGVAAAYSLSLVFILIAPYSNLKVDIEGSLAGAIALIPAALIICFVGLLDDIRGLKPWQKLIGETVAAVLAYHGGFGIYVFRGQPLETWVSLVISVVWLVGCANAMNMIDGMDGLAAGIALFASLTTLIAALTNQNLQLALVTAPLAGALLGFLRYNFNPASIFLGDCGSLLIGFLLGCYGALWSHKSATILGMTAPLMALSIPLLDVGIAIVRRYLRNKPIFGADKDHIHHRLLAQGLRPRRVAILLYGVSGLAAAFSLLQDATATRFSGIIIVLFCGAAWLGVQHLGYAEFDLARKFIFAGIWRQMIDVHVRVQEFDRALGKAESVDAVCSIIASGYREFGFCGVRMRVGSEAYQLCVLGETSDDCWQLRIPLGHGQYISLYRDNNPTMHPVVLSEFAEVVQRRLTSLVTSLPEAELQARAAAESAH